MKLCTFYLFEMVQTDLKKSNIRIIPLENGHVINANHQWVRWPLLNAKFLPIKLSTVHVFSLND